MIELKDLYDCEKRFHDCNCSYENKSIKKNKKDLKSVEYLSTFRDFKSLNPKIDQRNPKSLVRKWILL